jgi:copper chaperone CopZ
MFDSVLDAGASATSHDHEMNTWWSVASAWVLLACMGRFALQDAMRLKNRWFSSPLPVQGPTISVGVQGMTCHGCVAKLEKTLTGDERVQSATVTLKPGRVDIQGDISEGRVRELVEQAGFHPSIESYPKPNRQSSS